MENPKSYKVALKIKNKKEWKSHISETIDKYKSKSPDICENPTDEFLKDVMNFDFKFKIVLISPL